MIISLKPIGVAQNKQKQHFGDWNKVVTDLVINKDYQSAFNRPYRLFPHHCHLLAAPRNSLRTSTRPAG